MFNYSKRLTELLGRKSILFAFWCFIASFGAYFTMYAFRKPFNSAEYLGFTAFGMSLKTVLILSQVFGYMLSKFLGVKIISELKPNKRVILIIGLIVFAQLALIAFGVVPVPLKFVFLMLNGLPLGMVWGIIFSFLEGRKLTELIATGLSVSAIISSGSLKSLGRMLIENYGVSDFWMPSLIGFLFLPLFLLFVWMLSVIPAPNEKDVARKSKRLPMTKQDRRKTFLAYGVAIFTLVLTYTMLCIYRDFRDNFAVEIWNELDPNGDPSVFTTTEIPIALLVILITSTLTLFKSNYKGLLFTFTLIFIGLLLIGFSNFLFTIHALSPIVWMILNGLGLYMAYVPFQIVVYERFVALFKIDGNAGYFMYLSDSVGYLGSILVLVYKEFLVSKTNWLAFFQSLSYGIMIAGFILLLAASIWIARRYLSQRKSEYREEGSKIMLSADLEG